MVAETRFRALFDPGPKPETAFDLSAGVMLSRLTNFCIPASKRDYFNLTVEGLIFQTDEHAFWAKAQSRFPISRYAEATWKNMWVSNPLPYTVLYRAGFFLQGILTRLDQDSVDFIDWLFEHVTEKPYQGEASFFHDYRVWLQLADYESRLLHNDVTAPILYVTWESALKERIRDIWDPLNERENLSRALDRAAEAFAHAHRPGQPKL